MRRSEISIRVSTTLAFMIIHASLTHPLPERRFQCSAFMFCRRNWPVIRHSRTHSPNHSVICWFSLLYTVAHLVIHACTLQLSSHSLMHPVFDSGAESRNHRNMPPHPLTHPWLTPPNSLIQARTARWFTHVFGHAFTHSATSSCIPPSCNHPAAGLHLQTLNHPEICKVRVEWQSPFQIYHANTWTLHGWLAVIQKSLAYCFCYCRAWHVKNISAGELGKMDVACHRLLHQIVGLGASTAYDCRHLQCPYAHRDGWYRTRTLIFHVPLFPRKWSVTALAAL